MLSFHTTLQTKDKPAIKSSRPNAAIFSEFTSKQIQAPAERHRDMPLLTELEQFCGCVATKISPQTGLGVACWSCRLVPPKSDEGGSDLPRRSETRRRERRRNKTNGVEGEIKTCSRSLCSWQRGTGKKHAKELDSFSNALNCTADVMCVFKRE
jgi:hypothetical protein